jgi:putative DNA primase/helicase
VLCPGPGHSPKDRSLSVKIGRDGQLVVHSHAGDDWKECRDYVRQRLGMEPFKPNGSRKTVATYEFRDPASGEARYRKERVESADGTKSFFFKPAGRNGCEPLLYGAERLADVTSEQPVFIVEGEKKVDRLRELGAAAVSGDSGSSSKWLPAHADLLRGLAIILWPDSDEPGEKYAARAAGCLRNSAASLKVVRPFGPPNGAKGRDVCDWTGNADDLAALTAGAEPYVAREQLDEREPEELPAPGARKQRKKQPAVPSEDALALDFADRHNDELRFVSFWGKWLKWTAGRWQVEKTLAAYDLARKICHGHSLGGLRARTVAAIELMARSDRRLAATTDQWDADPWLFNTPAGTVELITGNLREHRPQDYIMKIAGCSPGAEGCPMFFEFLDTIFAKDRDLISYLQKFFGYILTGLTTEHAMLFFHGAGANGKSVLVSTIAGILGEYHRVAPIDTFTATGFSRHSTDLAGLMGARLVTAHETEEGAKWAEAKLKALTGGDKITAQFLRQDYFDYAPAFKLAITGNHKPGLQSVDEAMRRRLNLIPFNVTIPKADRDPSLAEKLKAEWPGILAWMIDGCLIWQEEGRLNPPQAVITATDEYLESEDAVATWIADRCELKASYEDTAAELFKSWKAWAELMHENVGSAKAFSNKLVSRPGIRRNVIGHSKARGFSGIRVIKIEDPPQRSFYRDD